MSSPIDTSVDTADLRIPVFFVSRAGAVIGRNACAEAWHRAHQFLGPAAWPRKAVAAAAAGDGPVTDTVSLVEDQPGLTVVCLTSQSGATVMVYGAEDGGRHQERVRCYEEVTDLAGVGGWEFELATMTPIWSAETCRIHGVDVGHVPDLEEAVSYFPGSARRVIRDAIRKAVEEGESYDLELPFVNRKGEHRWVRTRGRATLSGGRLVRLSGTLEDITSRRRQREELEEALGRARIYRALFRDAHAMMAVVDERGFLVEVNHAWGSVLGWTDADLLGAPLVSFIHPNDRERTVAELDALRQRGHKVVDFVNRYRRADGTFAHLSWVSTADADTGRVFGIARDISAERAREASLRRLALIASRTTNAVLITNVQGEVEWTNESFERITGFTRDEVVGLRPGSFLQGPETDREEVARIRALVQAQQPFHATVLNYRKDKTPYWVAIEAQPLTDQAGQFSGYMALEADVTAEVRTQRDLVEAKETAERHARDARSAMKAKGDFLAVMSHELRTPLNGILGAAELLAESPLRGTQVQLLAILRSSGTGLLTLLNDVLDYSKFEDGTFQVEQDPVDLTELLAGVGETWTVEAERRGLTFSVDVDAGVPAHMLGDAFRLRQVLTNLLGNAVKFTEVGGVTVRVTSRAGRMLRLEVEDTGIGIREDAGAMLFAPFTQVDASARRRFGGTGLGLAICHQLVTKMGGHIGFSSTVGVGSLFWIELPLVELAASGEDALVSARPLRLEGGVRRCLVAEDNPVNRILLSKMLVSLGCEVTLVEDGVAALDELGRSEFDVVLMDCHMPRLDGWAATRELRSRERAGDLPGGRTVVIAQTASCLPEDVQRCYDAGMDDFVAKPLRLAQLQEVLSRWSGGASA